MKKLGLLVMPLIAISLLASCGETNTVKYSILCETDGITLSNSTAIQGQNYSGKINLNEDKITQGYVLPSALTELTSDGNKIDEENYSYSLNAEKTKADLNIPASEIKGDIIIVFSLINPAVSHNIILNLSNHLTVEDPPTSAKEGDPVTFILMSNDVNYGLPKGITFDSLIVDGSYEPSTSAVSFTMPSGDCSVTAEGRYLIHNVTLNLEHVTSVDEPSEGKEGNIITFNLSPESSDYELPKTITFSDNITDGAYNIGDGKVTFTMPDGNCSVTAEGRYLIHSITLSLTHATSEDAPEKAKEDNSVEFTIKPDENYKLPETITFSDNITDGVYNPANGKVTFTMPDNDCWVSLEGRYLIHNISLNLTDVTALDSPASAKEGNEVAFTLEAAEDYNLPETITFSDNITDGVYNPANGKVTFTMPDNDCSVTAIGIVKTGTVIWENYDGTILETDENVRVNTEPSYDSNIPAKPKDESGIYNFTGWEPEIHNVTEGNNIYTAKFDIINLVATMTLEVPENGTFSFVYKGDGEIMVDWGDDSDLTSSNSHTYTTQGTYEISIYGNKITSIGAEGATYIKNVVLKKGITELGDGAFRDCSSLISISIPDGVTSIGDRAFESCKALTDIVIPDSVTYVGEGAFMYCYALPRQTYDNAFYLSSVSNQYFLLTGPTSLNITNCKINQNCKFIADLAFSYCEQLVSVDIPNGIPYIHGYTFYDCLSLDNVIIPNTVTSIGSSAFINCKSLKSITLSDNLVSIGQGAFMHCTSLESLTIPPSVTDLSDFLLVGCSSLFSLTLPTLFNKKLVYYFDNSSIPDSLKNLTLTNENSMVKDAFAGATNLSSLTVPSLYGQQLSYYFGGSVPTSLQNITLTDEDSIANNAFASCTSLTNVNLSGSFTAISKNAFNNCRSLESVTLHDGVESIGNSAFANCSALQSINLPSSITLIDESSFSGCESLNNIIIPNKITEIKTYAFYFCSSLSNIVLSDNITSIDMDAFAHCISLKNLTIPNKVTTIGSGAFSTCTALDKIIIPNSVTLIDSNAFRASSSLALVDLTAFGTSSTIPTLGEKAFTGCASTLTFSVASKAMANKFIESGKGWPTTESSYTWPKA